MNGITVERPQENETSVIANVLLRALQLQSVWAKHDPRGLHWHIGPLGVLPEWQGKGVGSQLLNEALESIDQKNGATYLETDRPINLPFYQRAGFVVIGEEKILGVTNWFLWRAPRK